MSPFSKLNRLKKHIVRDSKTKAPEQEPAAVDEPAIRFWNKWAEAGVVTSETDGEICLIKEQDYPLETRHGHYTFQEAKDVISKWQSFQGGHPLCARGYAPEDLFFFDIETTGLSGSGSVIFLLGTARLLSNCVRVKQYVLPSPGHETALYRQFLQDTDATALVTYNGKSFDWPHVKSRHVFVRDRVPELPAVGHFDLYHASRRLFGHTIESVKLVEVEKAHLGIERTGDVPGHLAPIIYFDFVERGDPEGLLEMMKHNERDILSLITLYTHISRLVLFHEKETDSKRSLELGKWFEAAGNDEAAVSSYTRSLQSAQDDSSGDAAYKLAMQWKKAGGLPRAIALFQKAKQTSGRYRIESAEELAKWFEHREKNIEAARAETVWALQQPGSSEAKTARLQKRLNRLEQKMSK